MCAILKKPGQNQTSFLQQNSTAPIPALPSTSTAGSLEALPGPSNTLRPDIRGDYPLNASDSACNNPLSQLSSNRSKCL